VVMTPACPAAPPGYARCSADKISYPAG